MAQISSSAQLTARGRPAYECCGPAGYRAIYGQIRMRISAAPDAQGTPPGLQVTLVTNATNEERVAVTRAGDRLVAVFARRRRWPCSAFISANANGHAPYTDPVGDGPLTSEEET